MNSIAVLDATPPRARHANPAAIVAAVAAGATLEGMWPQLARGVVLAIKIAFFIVMSTR